MEYAPVEIEDEARLWLTNTANNVVNTAVYLLEEYIEKNREPIKVEEPEEGQEEEPEERTFINILEDRLVWIQQNHDYVVHRLVEEELPKVVDLLLRSKVTDIDYVDPDALYYITDDMRDLVHRYADEFVG